MNKSIELQQAVLQDVVSMMGDNSAMKKLQKFIKTLKSEKEEKTECITRDEILSDLKESLLELKSVKQGKRKSRPVKELINEL